MIRLLRESGEIVIQRPSKAPSTAAAIESERGVIELAVTLAYTIASASEPSARVIYLRLVRNTLVPVVEIDDRHLRIGRAFPLADHPFMAEAVAAKEPRMGAFSSWQTGPQVREIATRIGVLAGIAVPVIQETSVHGVLAIGCRSPNTPDDMLLSLINVGRLLELALYTVLLRRKVRGLKSSGSHRFDETRGGRPAPSGV